MLDQTVAIRFDRRMGSGKTHPCLLSCRRQNGDEIEVVAKFSAGCERAEGALVAEAIAALLAADLGLPIPEPVLVFFDDTFVALIPSSDREVERRLRASNRVAFGSQKLPPGFTSLPLGKPVPQGLRLQAFEILAFDLLIQNPDRRPGNPNCLLNGRCLAIFDHELSFMTKGIIGWRPPWEPGSLTGIAEQHVFFQDIKGRAPDLDRFRGAWESISDTRLTEYRHALPQEWSSRGSVADEALAYVAKVRDNINDAMAEIVRVLT